MNTCRQPFLLFMHMQPSKLLTYKEEKKKNGKKKESMEKKSFLGITVLLILLMASRESLSVSFSFSLFPSVFTIRI